MNKIRAHHYLINLHFTGEPVDIDNLQLFHSFTNIHTWTSVTILNHQALIVTKKKTYVVTLPELETLSTHLGLTLQIDEARNGRVWAFKEKGHIILSNKNFNDLPKESNYTTTTCQVAPDILSFHTHLERLVAQAKHVHQNFLDIHIAFPALHLLDDTCFLRKPFTDLLQLSLATHETCLNKKTSQNKNKRSNLLG